MSRNILVLRLRKLLGSKVPESKIISIANRLKVVSTGESSKYHSMKIEYNGDVYSSLSEAYYSMLLDELVKQGKLKSVLRQVRFPLENMEGKPRLSYNADFVILNNLGHEYIVDVKGLMTPEATIKYAYFQYVYKKKIHLVSTTGEDKFRYSFLFN